MVIGTKGTVLAVYVQGQGDSLSMNKNK